jgi:hypothetical protein
MAGAHVPGYQAFWADRRVSLQSEYQVLLKQYPDADKQYRLLYTTICDIEDLAGCTPAAIWESTQWTEIVNTAEDNRANYCKALSSMVLLSALHWAYTVALKKLKSLLKASNKAGGNNTTTESVKPSQDDGFKEFRRRKRHSTNEAAPTSKKPAAETKNTPNKEVATRDFFAPLRATNMDIDTSGAEATTVEEAVSGKAGRPPPIILTATTNLIQLQRQLKNVSKGEFEFRNTKTGTRVITKSMMLTCFSSDAVTYIGTENSNY